MDGIDMALCRFTGSPRQTDSAPQWRYEFLDTDIEPWPDELCEAFRQCFEWSAPEFAEFNCRAGQALAAAALRMIRKNKVTVDCIASHGQTLFHQPGRGYSVQAGDGETMSAHTGHLVITSFRQKNVALGGEGAPLVPAGEKALFPEFNGFVNLGGIANISAGMKGRDVCFCNLLLNAIARRLPGSPDCDFDGQAAAGGHVSDALLARLHGTRFADAAGQSLSQEIFDELVVPLLDGSGGLSIADMLATACRFIAESIHESFSGLIAEPGARILVTGGGARNHTLLGELRKAAAISSSPVEYQLPQDPRLIDFKEALIFAWLGLCVLRGEPNCFPDSTRSRTPVCGGSIHLPPSGGYKLLRSEETGPS